MSLLQHKAAGNAALQSGNTSLAIEEYTKAINADGSNHVYYSNRSAAYLKQGDGHNALDDAQACLNLNPSFIKGYSRKGAALHALKRYHDSKAAYNEGLENAPDDAGLKKGLAEVERDESGGGSTKGIAGGLFGPQMMAQMAMDPRLRPYLQDADLMAKIKLCQENPAMASTLLQDPKMMQVLSVMMGVGTGADMETETTTSPPAPKTEVPEPMKVEEPEEDLSQLSPAERAKKEQQKEAVAKKTAGNELYKAKKFEEALAAYDEAIALDPENMTFLSNKAAVYFAQCKYDECIAECLKAVEVGKGHRAPFEDRAKAYARAARAYQKQGKLGEAIDMCKEAQLEAFDKNTQRLLKTLELEKKKADATAYQDDAKAEEAKQRGNDAFRSQDWPTAVKEYEEAVKRAPKNAPIRNNLAAALCKVMDFTGAQRQIEEAIELDPKYVKAWARKGDIEMVMKEFHKAMDSFRKGLELESDNKACKDGLQKCMVQINYGRSNMTEAEKQQQKAHAMADPEIQAILQDPMMQQVLRDFSENPHAAQKAMQNPGVQAKIEKLIAAGVVEMK